MKRKVWDGIEVFALMCLVWELKIYWPLFDSSSVKRGRVVDDDERVANEVGKDEGS